MELVYSVDYRSLPKSSDFLLEDKTVCSLSCKNILAFSRQSSGNKDGYVLWWLGGRVMVVGTLVVMFVYTEYDRTTRRPMMMMWGLMSTDVGLTY